jgi:hypothetical protein
VRAGKLGFQHFVVVFGRALEYVDRLGVAAGQLQNAARHLNRALARLHGFGIPVRSTGGMHLHLPALEAFVFNVPPLPSKDCGLNRHASG